MATTDRDKALLWLTRQEEAASLGMSVDTYDRYMRVLLRCEQHPKAPVEKHTPRGEGC